VCLPPRKPESGSGGAAGLIFMIIFLGGMFGVLRGSVIAQPIVGVLSGVGFRLTLCAGLSDRKRADEHGDPDRGDAAVLSRDRPRAVRAWIRFILPLWLVLLVRSLAAAAVAVWTGY
jgi:hypothetical protein